MAFLARARRSADLPQSVCRPCGGPRGGYSGLPAPQEAYTPRIAELTVGISRGGHKSPPYFYLIFDAI